MQTFTRAPAFTLTVVSTLAVGVASVVAMCAVYRAVVLDPVRLADPDTVVGIARVQRDPQVPTSLSWPRVQAMQRDGAAFSALGAYSNERVSLSAPGALPRELRALRVSAGFFESLRLAPAQGRLLAPADDLPNGPAVCVLAHETWQAVFGGAAIVGQAIRLDGRSVEVVGVLPARLTAPWGDREIFLPRVFEDSSLTPASVAAGASYLSVVARLAPGRTIGQADEEMRAVSGAFARAFAGRSDTINDVLVQPLADVVTANRRSTLALVLGAVAFVLLISCANAAALMAGRLAGRERELSVRQVLGASRARIVRDVLSESLTLAAVSGGLGLVLARVMLRLVATTLGDVLPPGVDLALRGPVLVVAVIVVFVVAILVGLAPALQATRASASGAAAFARGSTDNPSTLRFRRGLVIVEVALSTCLLICAALFLTSLVAVHRVPLGIDPAGTAAAAVILPAGRYDTPERQVAFADAVLTRVRPQVRNAAVSFGLPFAPDNFVSPYVIQGRPIRPPAERRRAGLRIVTEDYLQVSRMPLVAGRFFTAGDRAGSHPVCVVNRAFARREFGDRSPLGAVVLRGREANQPVEIVGVVGDVRTNGPTADPPDELFLPFAQSPRPNAWLIVRTNEPEDRAAPILQAAVAAVDPDLSTSGFTTMRAARDLTLGPERLLAGFIAAFAAVAVLLAAVGLYAVLAQSVSARTAEIGIRMAVGAARGTIGTLVLGGALRLVAIGIAAGTAGAFALSGLLAAQLHGVSTRDPSIYAGVAAAFLLVAVGAAAGPVRRATAVDPLVCLRS